MRVLPALLACLALASALPAAKAAADDVTIYRCTDAKDRLALRDTPCNAGEQQETREMTRPKDSTAPPVAPTPPPARPVAAPTTRVVVVSPPQPLYECITSDGDRYTSDTGDGNPRWVPLWTLGYPGYRAGSRPVGSGIGSRPVGSGIGNGIGNGSVIGGKPVGSGIGNGSATNIDTGSFRSHGGRPDTGGRPHDGGVRYPLARYGATGTWVRDTCHQLPPREVCARLVDRRDDVRRKFFNAMPSERAKLRLEERGINARLENDCGRY